jgi:hypothetical protein
VGWWRRARTTVHGGALQAVPVRSDGTQPQNGLSFTSTSESSLEKMRKVDSGRPF